MVLCCSVRECIPFDVLILSFSDMLPYPCAFITIHNLALFFFSTPGRSPFFFSLSIFQAKSSYSTFLTRPLFHSSLNYYLTATQEKNDTALQNGAKEIQGVNTRLPSLQYPPCPYLLPTNSLGAICRKYRYRQHHPRPTVSTSTVISTSR